jgi:quaternary ammonium compound-resistance protein SugE
MGIWSPWLWIALAGVLEVAWAIGLKYSDGLSKLLPASLTIVLMVLSFVCLARGVRTLPIGTGYAVWTGIGTLGAAILGMVLFHEPATLTRIGLILLIVAGIVGLKLTTP